MATSEVRRWLLAWASLGVVAACTPVTAKPAETTPAGKAIEPREPAAPDTGSKEETADVDEAEPEEAKAEDVFFAALPLEASPEVSQLALNASDNLVFARNLRVRMHVMRGYDNLGELTRRTGLPLVNGVFQMSDLSHLDSRDRPIQAFKQSSFVVDFDEPGMAAPSRALDAENPKPSPDDVARFVSEYIEQKSYQRAFDIASRVAESKAGDCTEHAVLTAALLRERKIPARVLLGVVLLAVARERGAPRLMAVGHSWVEYHDGKRWQIADAALRPQDERSESRTGAPDVQDPLAKLRLVYLPIKVMSDEGVGFARALMNDVGVESVVRIELDAAAVE